jgi:heme-degrading monooxygenase HmoA
MFARVETFHAEAGDIDDLISAQHHTVGLVRTMNGNMGGYVLVDRDSGHLMNVTFWQSQEDEDAAEGEFEASAQRGHVGRYAVAMQEALGTV